MGIYDRDYMRRTPEPAGRGQQSGEEKLERLLSGLLGKQRRWLLVVGLGILGLILVGLLWALIAS